MREIGIQQLGIHGRASYRTTCKRSQRCRGLL